MGSNKIRIYRKDNVRGEDGYKTFSIRIKETTVSSLDELAEQSNRSRNDLINIILEYAIKNVEILDQAGDE